MTPPAPETSPDRPGRPRSAWALRALSAPLALAAVVSLLLVVVTPLDLRGQFLFGLGVFAASLILNRLHAGRMVTLAMVMVSITVSTRYLFWRFTVTLNSDFTLEGVLGLILLTAELYAFAMLLLGYFQVMAVLPRKPHPLPPNTARWPTLDVFIPTYNEPLEVVRATVLAAKAMDWPGDKLRVFILDDGRRDAFRSFAAAASVGYIVRPDNKHAKAGNLNHALARTQGELIAIFDCDHVPTRSFLQMTVGWFLYDRRLAMIQTPHHFYSPDPFERNLSTFRTVPNEGELFYHLIQPSTDLWNATFFCGSCAVLRRTALDDVGGIAVETVTEDAHTALKMQRLGWNTAYLDVIQAAGLATESISAHVGQRIRWARGMAQIFRIDNPLLGRGLTLMQRVCYTGATLHFFYGIPRLIFLIAPLSYPLFGLHIFNALPLVALSFFLPHIAHSTMTNSRIQGKFRHSFWSEVYETCLAIYILIPTTQALITPSKGKFNVTAKGGNINQAYFERRIAMPYLVLTALNLVGFLIGAFRLWSGAGRLDVLLINLGWSTYNLVILTATIAVAWEQRQVRKTPRVATKVQAMVRLENGRTVRCRTADLSRGGSSLLIPPGWDLLPKDRIHVSLFSAADELPIPAEVIDLHDGLLRVRFGALSIDQESALVQALVSRADSWLGWRDAETVDHPLGSLRDILVRGLGNVNQILRARPPLRAIGEATPAATLAVPVGAMVPPIPLAKVSRAER